MTSGPGVLTHFPPMGIYETLFAFLDANGVYMGDPGTHPWSQGFPLTTQLPDGPSLPDSVAFDSADLKYPSATGNVPLLEAIRDYYNNFYDAGITTDNVCVFAGGRPGIFATLAFLKPEIRVLIEETEYTPYYDLLKNLRRPHTVVPSNPANRFQPTLSDYQDAKGDEPAFIIRSNPCNPTGVAWSGDQLRELVGFCSAADCGGIIDEAYEFFHDPEPVSALKFIEDIDETNIFVVGAATKGLQVPGLRVGWVVAARHHVELFRNFSSIAMGGVARPSQICVTGLLDLPRVTQARTAVRTFFSEQRRRYREVLSELGFEIFTGEGGFYHWARLPGGLTAKEFNARLFPHKAAILPGTMCDILRRGDQSPMADFIRFSFGPLLPESLPENVEILRACLQNS